MTCDAWPVTYPYGREPSDADATVVTLALDLAQTTLWSLSGRRYGECSTTETYEVGQRGSCRPTPELGDDKQWRNLRAGSDVIHLAQRPVRSISKVIVDGELQLPATYRLSRNRLMKLPRGQAWPGGVDIDVTYDYGMPLDSGAELAMGELTLEFVAALTGRECRLPSRVISVVRQGVTSSFETWETLFTQNRTGVTIADHWLRSVNPGRIAEGVRVYSPDMAVRR